MAGPANEDNTLELLDEMLDSLADWQSPGPLDAHEKDGKYILELAVPGFDPKDIEVEVRPNAVCVKGTQNERTDKVDAKHPRRETRRSTFTRSAALPRNIDTDSVVATLSDGMLSISLTLVKRSQRGRSKSPRHNQ